MSLAHGTQIVKHGPLTDDAFLGGRLNLRQPERGFRAGLDSVLLGAAVGQTGESLLDLGAGAGTAALVVLADQKQRRATLVEADAGMADIAAQNIELNGFSERARVLHLDLTAPGRARAQAGLAADHFDSVIANPPYYENGTEAAPARARARQMGAEALDIWIRTAATHAAPGGEVIFVHLAERLPALLAGFDSRFGALTVLPLSPRAGLPAHRVLIRGIKGSRAPLTLLASRPLHEAGGRTFLPEFEAIFRGTDRLHW